MTHGKNRGTAYIKSLAASEGRCEELHYLCVYQPTAAVLVTSSGRSTWFVGVFVLMVFLVF
jgi:hypothetical protein